MCMQSVGPASGHHEEVLIRQGRWQDFREAARYTHRNIYIVSNHAPDTAGNLCHL